MAKKGVSAAILLFFATNLKQQCCSFAMQLKKSKKKKVQKGGVIADTPFCPPFSSILIAGLWCNYIGLIVKWEYEVAKSRLSSTPFLLAFCCCASLWLLWSWNAKLQSGNLKMWPKNGCVTDALCFTTLFKHPYCHGLLRFNGSKKRMWWGRGCCK